MKRAAAIMLALSLALGLNGCGSGLTIFSNYRRLENIELVRTVTADAEGGDITATVYSDAGKESDPRMYQRTASSIGVALGELQLMALGRVALLSHTENMLIGEELAAESLGECLDYVERYSEMRLDTGLMIVREGTARELVSGLSGPDAPSSDVIKGFADNISRAGQGYVFSCREIIASLCENGYALAMCVAGEKAEDKLFESRGELDIRPRGLAVLTAEGISGFLDDEETTGALLVLSKYRSKDMDIPVGDTVVTLDLDGFETQVRPVFDREGALRGMKIKLHVSANIINLSGTAEVSRRGGPRRWG